MKLYNQDRSDALCWRLASAVALPLPTGLHDRHFEHRAGQWLARGNGLRDEGAGAGLGQGRRAQHRAPQHRCRGPARGSPQPDRGGCRCHRRQPGQPRRHQLGDQGSDRKRHRRGRRRPGGDANRRPMSCPTTRKNTPISAPNGCSRQIGGEGDVVYMRGAAGAAADNDRDKGFKRALAEFPDVKVVHEVFTGWQQDQGKQQILDLSGHRHSV